jgi:hypothetical protein
MDDQEFDSLFPAGPFGTVEAVRAEARLRRCGTLGLALWGRTADDLRRQLRAPYPEIPSGFDLEDFRELQRFAQLISSGSHLRETWGCLLFLWRLLLRPFLLVLNALRRRKIVARYCAARLSICKNAEKVLYGSAQHYLMDLLFKDGVLSEGKRSRLSLTQRTDSWSRWKAGQSLHEIGLVFDTSHSSGATARRAPPAAVTLV